MHKLLKLMRPYSWIKNFFIFIPLFFAKEFFIYPKLITVVWAFVVFSIAASSVYILNDIFDIKQDQTHSIKKNRPLASGAVSLKTAIITCVSLLIVDVFLIFIFIPQIFWLVGSYFILNFFYSVYLKHIPVLDILLVSSFYFIRIMIGGIAANVPISNWLLVCIIFISLFLIVSKRLAEFGKENRRAVLQEYSREFLNAMLIISATLIIISYSLYSVFVLNSNLAVGSIFLVLLGIIRYLFLVFTTHSAEYPEKVVIKDKVILLSVIAWVLLMFFIIYLHV